MRLGSSFASPEIEEREGTERVDVERTSGVFLRARKVARKSAAPSAEEVARAVQAVTRTWAAVLFVPGFRAGGRASVVPAPVRADDSGFSLVMRLGAWLPQAGDGTRELAVPAYVRRWMPIDRALVVPIQTLDTMGWIAVPFVGATREQVRRLEEIASSVALDLDRADRSERVAALAGR